MGDSLFYTDEMLEEMDRHLDSLDEEKVSEVDVFLQECKNIEDKINSVSDKLNEDGIEKLNINGELKELVDLIEKLHNKYENLTMTAEEKTNVTEVINKVKENFVALLNKHIARYNTKVDYINARVKEMTTKLVNVELSDEVKEMINRLQNVSRCETFNNGDWRQLNYLDTLDYSELEEQYKNISLVQKKLKIKSMESVEIWASCNHIELVVAELEKEIKEEMTLSEINKLINKCYVCYEQIVDTDIRYALFRDGLSDKKRVSKNNSKLVKAMKKLDIIEKELLDKRSLTSNKTSSYKEILFKLELLEKKYDVITRKINEYKGKCNKGVINRLNDSYLKGYAKEFEELQEKIELEKENLDVVQYRNLTKKIKKITRKKDSINFDLNISPIMLNGVDVGLDFENKMKEFDAKLDELNDKIVRLGEDKLKFIKDHGVRKEIDGIINARWKEIYAYDKLLSSYKKESPEVYKALNGKLDDKKAKFDKICKEYRGKCPLGVKQVKSAKHLYKKHRKEALIIAGLSTMVLLLGSNVLVPAIMHGNIMISAKSAAMRPFIKTVNNVLGGMIGASKDINGGWFLANGLMINPSVASTSLLKGLAISGLGQTALLSPAIAGVAIGIKNLVGKMKSGELKKKMQESKEKKVQKSEERAARKKNNNVRREIQEQINMLFKQYLISRNEHGMTLEEFAIKNELNDNQVSILKSMEELETEMKNSKKSSGKGGR